MLWPFWNLHKIFYITKNSVQVAYDQYVSSQKEHTAHLLPFLQNKIEIKKEELVKTTAINQVTQEKFELEIPKFLLNGEAAKDNNALISKFHDITGTTVTIFQIIPQGMLRIATNIQKKDGTLATGTFIPKDSPVYQKVSNGEVFNGLAYVVNGNYVTSYVPLKDKAGLIVGAIYTGVPATSLESIKKNLKEQVIYETGYIFVIDGKGLAIIHPTKEGENIAELKDATGRSFIREILEQKNGTLQYMWEDQDKIVTEKIIAFKYVPETNWIIIGGSSRNEAMKPVLAIRNKMFFMGIALLALSVFLATILRRSIMAPIAHIQKELNHMVDESLNGNLKYRADVSQTNEEFAPIVGGVNKVLDAVLDPVNEVVKVMKEVSQGNLTHQMKGEYKGDHNILKDSINTTILSMNNILGKVNSSIHQVETGAGQIADSSQVLSQGATETAASLEEITSSMNEMQVQTKQNAENSDQAFVLSSKAKEAAEKGNEQMKKMISAMEGINDSSTKISKIIKVIDEIAFQTNLLALNAAVEAARAGKHGKGFAVVAEEVRNLASRSAQAARETTSMIEDSASKVNSGAEVTKETAAALEGIVTNVEKTNLLVKEISASSNHQAKSITQVSTALEQIEQVTQRNTATAEETAAASEELSSQSAELKSLIENFQLDDNSGLAIQSGGYKKAA